VTRLLCGQLLCPGNLHRIWTRSLLEVTFLPAQWIVQSKLVQLTSLLIELAKTKVITGNQLRAIMFVGVSMEGIRKAIMSLYNKVILF